MKTKGKSLKSFATNIEVCNYPMRERSQSELEELDMVVGQRKIEKIQSELRESVLPDGFGSYSSIVGEMFNILCISRILLQQI